MLHCIFVYLLVYFHILLVLITIQLPTPKPPLKVHKIKGAKDFTVAQVLYIYAIVVIDISRVQCIYNDKNHSILSQFITIKARKSSLQKMH